jgi:hypothetical protein
MQLAKVDAINFQEEIHSSNYLHHLKVQNTEREIVFLGKIEL